MIENFMNLTKAQTKQNARFGVIAALMQVGFFQAPRDHQTFTLEGFYLLLDDFVNAHDSSFYFSYSNYIVRKMMEYNIEIIEHYLNANPAGNVAGQVPVEVGEIEGFLSFKGNGG